GKIIITNKSGQKIGEMFVEGEALSIALKDSNSPHYLLRAMQRQMFGEVDKELTGDIKGYQTASELPSDNNQQRGKGFFIKKALPFILAVVISLNLFLLACAQVKRVPSQQYYNDYNIREKIGNEEIENIFEQIEINYTKLYGYTGELRKLVKMGKPAIPYLIKGMDNKNVVVRLVCIDALTDISTLLLKNDTGVLEKEIIPALTKKFTDEKSHFVSQKLRQTLEDIVLMFNDNQAIVSEIIDCVIRTSDSRSRVVQNESAALWRFLLSSFRDSSVIIDQIVSKLLKLLENRIRNGSVTGDELSLIEAVILIDIREDTIKSFFPLFSDFLDVKNNSEILRQRIAGLIEDEIDSLKDKPNLDPQIIIEGYRLIFKAIRGDRNRNLSGRVRYIQSNLNSPDIAQQILPDAFNLLEIDPGKNDWVVLTRHIFITSLQADAGIFDKIMISFAKSTNIDIQLFLDIMKIHRNKTFQIQTKNLFPINRFSLAESIQLTLRRFDRELNDENINKVVPFFIDIIEEEMAERVVIDSNTCLIVIAHAEDRFDPEKIVDWAKEAFGIKKYYILKGKEYKSERKGVLVDLWRTVEKSFERRKIKNIVDIVVNNPGNTLVWLTGNGLPGRFFLNEEDSIDSRDISAIVAERIKLNKENLSLVEDACYSGVSLVRTYNSLKNILARNNFENLPFGLAIANRNHIAYGNGFFEAMQEISKGKSRLTVEDIWGSIENIDKNNDLNFFFPISRKKYLELKRLLGVDDNTVKKIEKIEEDYLLSPDLISPTLPIIDQMGKQVKGEVVIEGGKKYLQVRDAGDESKILGKVELIPAEVKNLIRVMGILRDTSEEYGDILGAFFEMLQKSPPGYYVYSKLLGDLFGAASSEHNLIALYQQLSDNPTAVFHEVSEYLQST
ncbi:MAG: hypothetical protein V1759_03230, partial [bacterium]